MKSLHYFLHIPTPCHENWDAMSEAEQGRYCQVCAKTVIDFSLMSNEEILQYLNTNSTQVCGRFANSQLKPQATLSHKLKVFLYALCTVFLLQVGEGVSAQSAGGNSIESKKSFFRIAGKVVDEKGVTLPKVEIRLISNDGENFETLSDLDGNYQCESLPKGLYTMWVEHEYYRFDSYHFYLAVTNKDISHTIELKKESQLQNFTMGKMGYMQERDTQRNASLTFFKVYGTIVDDNKRPLEDATVLIFENGIAMGGAKTDRNGNYTFSSVRMGATVSLKILYLGMKPLEIKDITVNFDRLVAVQMESKYSRNEHGNFVAGNICRKPPRIIGHANVTQNLPSANKGLLENLILNKEDIKHLPATNINDMIKIMDTDRFFTHW